MSYKRPKHFRYAPDVSVLNVGRSHYVFFHSRAVAGPMSFRRADREAKILSSHLTQETTMARRHYRRRNPIVADTETVVGGLIGLTVLTIGGYFLYKHFNPTPATSTASNPLLATSAEMGATVQGVTPTGVQTLNGYEVVPAGG